MSMARSYPAPDRYSREQLVSSHHRLQKELAATRRERDDYARRFFSREVCVFWACVFQVASETPSPAVAVSQSGGPPCVAPSASVRGDLEAGVWLWVPARLMFWSWSRRLPSWLLLFVRRQLFRVRRLLLKSRRLWPLRLLRIDLCFVSGSQRFACCACTGRLHCAGCCVFVEVVVQAVRSRRCRGWDRTRYLEVCVEVRVGSRSLKLLERRCGGEFEEDFVVGRRWFD